MTTLGNAAAVVLDMLSRTEADAGAQVRREIANAIRRYNRVKTHLTETRDAELTTVIGQTWYPTISLANSTGEGGRTDASVSVADVLDVQYMRREISGSGYREMVKRLHYTDFERNLEGPDAGGDPLYFTVHAGGIGLWPVPSAVQTLGLSIHVKPTVPSADGDTSAWLTVANELIECAAAKALASKYLQDYEKAAIFSTEEARHWNDFHAEFVRKGATGRLRVNE